jgi:Zn-finger nucleic acid-binding protein
MADQKDKFGDTMKLVERAKEDIYFAQRDKELIEKIKAQLQRVERTTSRVQCPKCPGKLETYTFRGFILDRCHNCGGIWMEKGELEKVIRRVTRSPLGAWIDKRMGKEKEIHKEGVIR